MICLRHQFKFRLLHIYTICIFIYDIIHIYWVYITVLRLWTSSSSRGDGDDEFMNRQLDGRRHTKTNYFAYIQK